jgi:hypothetical protein
MAGPVKLETFQKHNKSFQHQENWEKSIVQCWSQKLFHWSNVWKKWMKKHLLTYKHFIMWSVRFTIFASCFICFQSVFG